MYRKDMVIDAVIYRESDFYNSVLEEIEDHENLMNVDRSKWSWADNLWLIMPPLPGKSIRCALRSSFRNGLPGSSDVAFILSGTLKGLDHMHRVKNAVHPNVGADCIFIDGQRVVRLATRSLSYCTCDYVYLTCHVDFYVETSKCGGACGYPDWANPPELLTKKNGEGQKSNNKATDVCMFGLLAVELFYGRIPEDFRLWDIDARKKYKEKKKRNRLWSFFRREREEEEMPEELVAACLSDDPRKSDNNKFLKKGEKERWIYNSEFFKASDSEVGANQRVEIIQEIVDEHSPKNIFRGWENKF